MSRPFVNVAAATLTDLLPFGTRIAAAAVKVVPVPKLANSETMVVVLAIPSALWKLFAPDVSPTAYCTFLPDTTVGNCTSIEILVPSATVLASAEYAAALLLSNTPVVSSVTVPVYAEFPVYFVHCAFAAQALPTYARMFANMQMLKQILTTFFQLFTLRM